MHWQFLWVSVLNVYVSFGLFLPKAFFKVWWCGGLARSCNKVKTHWLTSYILFITLNIIVVLERAVYRVSGHVWTVHLTNWTVSSTRLQMSNTFYEAAGQNWFTLDSVHIHYNWTQEATFNASEVYAPATSSYHCQHVSSLHKYDTLLVPSSHTDTSANWHITFTDFQVYCRTKGTAFVV